MENAEKLYNDWCNKKGKSITSEDLDTYLENGEIEKDDANTIKAYIFLKGL